MTTIFSPSCVGLLGGTFDPVHLGHLYIARETMARLPIAHVQFIPCKQPPHRPPPIANTKDRLAMIQLAIQTDKPLSVNTLEIHRPGPSYTIDTLKTLHAQQPDTLFCFMLGEDAWNTFHEWHCYEDILNYCHLIVISRTKSSSLSWHKPWLAQHEITDPQELKQLPYGKIFRQALPLCSISGTAIRAQLTQGKPPRDKLSPLVLDYILTHHLYQ